jgi:D-amino-acid oxidase
MARPDILVVGAGVSGLTTGVRLAEAGFTVRLVTRLPPSRTTSAAAGASWGPYLVQDQRVPHWSLVTRSVLEALATEPGSGVRMVSGFEMAEEPLDPPEWASGVEDFRPCRPDELDAFGPYVCGWRYTIPLLDMPAYLDHLVRRLARAGADVEVGTTVSTFADLRGKAAVLVNCTGMGARTLVPDPALYPTRGQLVVMENPGIEEFFQSSTHGEELTYILPHGKHVVLGGSAVEHSEGVTPVAEVAERIVERCALVEPKLREARFIEHRVGFRPTRGSVRAELVDLDGVPLIHNYGHGGAGVSVSWGCAEEVRRLVDEAFGVAEGCVGTRPVSDTSRIPAQEMRGPARESRFR